MVCPRTGQGGGAEVDSNAAETASVRQQEGAAGDGISSFSGLRIGWKVRPPPALRLGREAVFAVGGAVGDREAKRGSALLWRFAAFALEPRVGFEPTCPFRCARPVPRASQTATRHARRPARAWLCPVYASSGGRTILALRVDRPGRRPAVIPIGARIAAGRASRNSRLIAGRSCAVSSISHCRGRRPPEAENRARHFFGKLA